MTTHCRCGWDGTAASAHKCHGKGYTCKNPGTIRFYNPNPDRFSLAGTQAKLSMSETCACDECWDTFKKETSK
jgi:hypothetical protein